MKPSIMKSVIKKRSKLTSKYHKIENTEDYKNYKKPINICSELIRKRKENSITT